MVVPIVCVLIVMLISGEGVPGAVGCAGIMALAFLLAGKLGFRSWVESHFDR